MKQIEAERARLCEIMDAEASGPRYAQAYAASIALSWALQPDRFAPPSDYISRIPVDSPDCSGKSHPAPLSDKGAPMLDVA